MLVREIITEEVYNGSEAVAALQKILLGDGTKPIPYIYRGLVSKIPALASQMKIWMIKGHGNLSHEDAAAIVIGQALNVNPKMIKSLDNSSSEEEWKKKYDELEKSLSDKEKKTGDKNKEKSTVSKGDYEKVPADIARGFKFSDDYITDFKYKPSPIELG